MIELLLNERDKAEKAVIYHAEQLQRADIKLELINEMLETAERKAAEQVPAETAEETTEESTEETVVE